MYYMTLNFHSDLWAGRKRLELNDKFITRSRKLYTCTIKAIEKRIFLGSPDPNKLIRYFYTSRFNEVKLMYNKVLHITYFLTLSPNPLPNMVRKMYLK